jgi:ABC-type multidrug transport system permease subunit
MKPIVAIYILIVTLIAHALEALYVAYLCSIMVMPKNSIVSWVSMTLIFGFPITTKVMALSHVAKKRKVRFD